MYGTMTLLLYVTFRGGRRYAIGPGPGAVSKAVPRSGTYCICTATALEVYRSLGNRKVALASRL